METNKQKNPTTKHQSKALLQGGPNFDLQPFPGMFAKSVPKGVEMHHPTLGEILFSASHFQAGVLPEGYKMRLLPGYQLL